MALVYKLKTCAPETDDDGKEINNKTRIGFLVVDEKGNQFAIDKILDTDSKSRKVLSKECYDACQTQVNEWVASIENIGDVWNPDTDDFS